MNPAKFWSLVAALCLIPAGLFGAAGAASTGVIKGTITIAGQPTQDVVISVEGAPQEQVKSELASRKTKKAVMDQRNMKFIPDVLPVLAGTTVEFPNNDTSWHNVYSKGGAKDFDLGLYPSGKSRSATFDKPGVVRILCNAHPTMEAFIVVKEHPYFSGAANRGNYQIINIPLGKARLEIWHPNLGTRTVPIDIVRPGEVVAVDVDLKK